MHGQKPWKALRFRGVIRGYVRISVDLTNQFCGDQDRCQQPAIMHSAENHLS